jgi:nucleoside-diphosphate-sugar epimerase
MEATHLQGEIFNIGQTESIRIVDLAKRIIAQIESESEIHDMPYDQGIRSKH